MKNTNKKIRAFTLIELLVVIVIIGVLAGIGMAQFNDYIDKAKYADATAEMKLIEKAVLLARINEQKLLREITGNGCTNCNCSDLDLRNISESSLCMITWMNSIEKISEASGVEEIKFYRDAWGSPYVFDENEGLTSNYCTRDGFISVGPDGMMSHRGPNYDPSLNIDNISFKLPFYDTKRCGN